MSAKNDEEDSKGGLSPCDDLFADKNNMIQASKEKEMDDADRGKRGRGSRRRV